MSDMTKEKILHIIHTKEWYITEYSIYYLDQDPLLSYDHIREFYVFMNIYDDGSYKLSNPAYSLMPWSQKVFMKPLAKNEVTKLSFMTFVDMVSYLQKLKQTLTKDGVDGRKIL